MERFMVSLFGISIGGILGLICNYAFSKDIVFGVIAIFYSIALLVTSIYFIARR